MFKFNNSMVPNKVRIGRHFSSNKYAYRDAYSALKSSYSSMLFHLQSRYFLKNINVADIAELLKNKPLIGPYFQSML